MDELLKEVAFKSFKPGRIVLIGIRVTAAISVDLKAYTLLKCPLSSG